MFLKVWGLMLVVDSPACHADTYLLYLLYAANLFLQLFFISIISLNTLDGDPTEANIKGYLEWRLKDAHSHSTTTSSRKRAW